MLVVLQSIWNPLLLGLCFTGIIMALTALVSNRWKNAGLVDVVWGFLLAILPWVYFITVYGFLPRKFIIASMLSIASFRLGWHLFRRFKIAMPEEDVRYHAMRIFWQEQHYSSGQIDFFFLLVFLLQALLMTFLSFPVLVIMSNVSPQFELVEYSAMGLWIIGMSGEWLADEQLRRFKQDPNNKGIVCNVGLWFTSRHPNYFFQWLLWVSYFLMSLASSGSWITVLSPITMLILLLKVSGIGPAEDQMLKSKGDAYKQYQQTTSPFIPWFKLPPPTIGQS